MLPAGLDGRLCGLLADRPMLAVKILGGFVAGTPALDGAARGAGQWPRRDKKPFADIGRVGDAAGAGDSGGQSRMGGSDVG